MSHFGPLIIGQAQFDKEQEELKSGAHIFGPAILEHPKKGEKGNVMAGHEPELEVYDEAPHPPAEEVESFSVRAVREALADNPVPSVVDRMVRAEMFRPEGPRKSALTECLRAEKRRDDPRPEVVDMLKDTIKELE